MNITAHIVLLVTLLAQYQYYAEKITRWPGCWQMEIKLEGLRICYYLGIFIEEDQLLGGALTSTCGFVLPSLGFASCVIQVHKIIFIFIHI